MNSAVPFSVDAFRQAFPILARNVHERPLRYLDSAASAQKPEPVIDAMAGAMQHSYANVHRGLHTLANETTAAFEAAREAARQYLGAASTDEIVFTSGGTDAVNLVASSIGQTLSPGDEIVLSVMEHHSNIVPWHFLRARYGAVLRWVGVDAAGALDLAALAAMISKRTRIITITGQSNVLGTRPPIKAIADMAHAVGALVVVDGCQDAVHGPLDVQAMDADFYVLTGHKIYGPTGIGVLYGRKAVLDRMPPYRGGGEMIDQVTEDDVSYAMPPHRFEAGTPPILEAIGLRAALEFVMAQDVAGLRAHETAITAYAHDQVGRLPGARIFGETETKGPVLAFNLGAVHPHDVATILDRAGVAVRAGHHCCQPLMRRLGVSATVRASFAAYTTTDDIDALIEACARANRILG